MFSIKIDVMREAAEMRLLGTQGEVQLSEFVRELEQMVAEGSLNVKSVLYDRSAARLMSARNDRWLTRIQELLLSMGDVRVAEVMTAGEPYTPCLSSQWQRFEKLCDAQTWLLRRIEAVAA